MSTIADRTDTEMLDANAVRLPNSAKDEEVTSMADIDNQSISRPSDRYCKGIHEAAHAIVQWLVGGESELVDVRLKIVGGKVVASEDGTGTNIRSPTSITTEHQLRCRLLMLCAGTAATQALCETKPNGIDFGKDIQGIQGALNSYLEEEPGLTFDPTTRSYEFRLPDANTRFCSALNTATDVVEHPRMEKAIRLLTDRLFSTLSEDRCLLTGREVAQFCEAELGETFRSKNPWINWLDGFE